MNHIPAWRQLPGVWRKEGLGPLEGWAGRGAHGGGSRPGTVWPVEGAPCLLDSCSQGGADGDGRGDNVLSTYNVAVAAPGFMLAMSVEPHPRQGQGDYPNFTMEEPAPQDQQMAEPGFKPELRLQSLSGAVYSLTDAQGPGDGLGPSPSSTISMLCDLGSIPYFSKPQLFIREMGIVEAPVG